MTDPITMLCPCNSQIPYAKCCEPYITGQTLPQTPEQLMRSRYTAFTQADAEYIGKTMCNQALKHYDANATREWALSMKWDYLTILCAPPTGSALTGIVHFKAHYLDNNQPEIIEEWSQFTKIDNQWYYTNTLKLGRNDPCACQSGKKYKKCCAIAI